MNSSDIHPFEQLLEYSGSAIKRDLRGSSKRSVEAQLLAQITQDSFIGKLRRERAVDLERAGAWSGDPFEELREAMEPCNYHGAGALGLVNHNIERLVGSDVQVEWNYPQEPPPAAAGIPWYEGALTHEGLKDKVVVVASESVRSPWMFMGVEQVLAAHGRTHDDLIFVTPGQYMEYVGVRVPSEMLAVIDELEPITRQFTCEPRRPGFVRKGKGKRSAFNRAERWR
jgi:hypothetical protein